MTHMKCVAVSVSAETLHAFLVYFFLIILLHSGHFTSPNHQCLTSWEWESPIFLVLLRIAWRNPTDSTFKLLTPACMMGYEGRILDRGMVFTLRCLCDIICLHLLSVICSMHFFCAGYRHQLDYSGGPWLEKVEKQRHILPTKQINWTKMRLDLTIWVKCFRMIQNSMHDKLFSAPEADLQIKAAR